MNWQERVALIKELQKVRGNSVVITYITSTRPGLDTPMAMDAIRKIQKHLEKIETPKSQTKIDLFIHSNGGEGIVPWRLVTLIREYCNEFNVLVPHRAFSAATLTAIGADNIYMHPMGMLGPTDPKVGNEFNPQDPLNPKNKLGINVEDVISYISLVKEDVGIHHEDELIKAFEYLASENRIHPLALGNVKRSYAQARMMANKLLELHMDKTQEHKIKEIADNLNSKLYFHGHPINRAEALDKLGLSVAKTTKRLEEAMWKLYLAYEEVMKLEDPFEPAIELKKAHPDLPYNSPTKLQGIFDQQGQLLGGTVSTEKINISDLRLISIESEKRSDTLDIEVAVEGYKYWAQPGGLQEVINISQTNQTWNAEES